jgi:hypothetical protein
MWWVAGWAVVTTVGVIGTVASLNSMRFKRRVAGEMSALARGARETQALDPARLAALPAPVRRYLEIALSGAKRPIRAVRLQHGGRFRPSLDGSWLAIRGEQYFRADPPAFIWRGRVRIAPGVWIDARDRSVDGEANMLVSAESTITLADSRGPELDQSALLRLLGEMTWMPTALLDDRYVRWSAVDAERARATLEVNGRSVTGELTFGADGLPSEYRAGRYRDVGGGRAVLTPFVGRLSDYRRVGEVLVPHRVVGAWMIDGTAAEYADFDVKTIEFD